MEFMELQEDKRRGYVGRGKIAVGVQEELRGVGDEYDQSIHDMKLLKGK